MKARFLIAFILSVHFSYAQLETAVADSMIYTFKLQLVQADLELEDCKENFANVGVQFKYRVLESDCKVPLNYAIITHFCPKKILFKSGNIYTVKGSMEFKYIAGLGSSYQRIPHIQCEYFLRDLTYDAIKKDN